MTELDLPGQPVIGLAKKLEEVFMPGESEPEILPKASTSLRLLQRIRDEAHRFAISYHRTLRSKRTLQTELDLIKGIGKKRAGELLEVFGSVQGVRFATVDQLAEIVGQTVAERVRSTSTCLMARPRKRRRPRLPGRIPRPKGPRRQAHTGASSLCLGEFPCHPGEVTTSLLTLPDLPVLSIESCTHGASLRGASTDFGIGYALRKRLSVKSAGY